MTVPKKSLKFYQDRLEAELAAQYLQSQQIQSEVRGHKEYASHLTGSQMGRYELWVDERYYEESERLLAEAQRQGAAEKIEVSPQRYLKRAIVYALLACVMMPGVFNFASVHSLLQYRKTEAPSKMKSLLTILVIALQLPGLVLLYMMLNGFANWVGTVHSKS